MKPIVTFIILLFLLPACSQKPADSQETATQNENPVDSLTTLSPQHQKLKNFAFCVCMTKVYPDFEKTFRDGSMGGYVETSNYGPDAFEAMDSLAKHFLETHNYQSFDDYKLGMMKCLDFYNSDELAKRIREFGD